MSRLLHVSLAAAGRCDETRDFYCELLGLEVAPRPKLPVPGHWLTLGGSQLHLNCRPTDPPQHSPGPTHPVHLCLGVPDLIRVSRALESAGYRVHEAGSLANTQFWVRDPAGNFVELQHDRGELT